MKEWEETVSSSICKYMHRNANKTNKQSKIYSSITVVLLGGASMWNNVYFKQAEVDRESEISVPGSPLSCFRQLFSLFDFDIMLKLMYCSHDNCASQMFNRLYVIHECIVYDMIMTDLESRD